MEDDFVEHRTREPSFAAQRTNHSANSTVIDGVKKLNETKAPKFYHNNWIIVVNGAEPHCLTHG